MGRTVLRWPPAQAGHAPSAAPGARRGSTGASQLRHHRVSRISIRHTFGRRPLLQPCWLNGICCDVIPSMSTPTNEPVYQRSISLRYLLQAANLDSAVTTALLLLPAAFSSVELFRVICGLSYMADIRMAFAEDSRKARH